MIVKYRSMSAEDLCDLALSVSSKASFWTEESLDRIDLEEAKRVKHRQDIETKAIRMLLHRRDYAGARAAIQRLFDYRCWKQNR
jgi:hypothetical protein